MGYQGLLWGIRGCYGVSGVAMEYQGLVQSTWQACMLFPAAGLLEWATGGAATYLTSWLSGSSKLVQVVELHFTWQAGLVHKGVQEVLQPARQAGLVQWGTGSAATCLMMHERSSQLLVRCIVAQPGWASHGLQLRLQAL